MINSREVLDKLFEEFGLPSTQKVIEARVIINLTFPDFRSRQAFLGTMVTDMCEEFDVDLNSLLDSWKEVL